MGRRLPYSGADQWPSWPASMINDCHTKPSALVMIKDFNSSVCRDEVPLCVRACLLSPLFANSYCCLMESSNFVACDVCSKL